MKRLLILLLLFNLSILFGQEKVTAINFWKNVPSFKENPKGIKTFINDQLGFYLYESLDDNEKKLLFSSYKEVDKFSILLSFVIPPKSGKLKEIKISNPLNLNSKFSKLISKLDFTYFSDKFNFQQSITYEATLNFVKPKSKSKIPFVFLPKKYGFASRLTFYGTSLKKKNKIENFDSRQEFIDHISKRSKSTIRKEFNTDLGAELGLIGLQKIFIQYQVDTLSNFINIKARAPHPRLQKEAISLFEEKNCKCILPNYFGYYYNLTFTEIIKFEIDDLPTKAPFKY